MTISKKKNHDLKSNKMEVVVPKLDIEKTYDCELGFSYATLDEKAKVLNQDLSMKIV
jgi:hypothetical protein